MGRIQRGGAGDVLDFPPGAGCDGEKNKLQKSDLAVALWVQTSGCSYMCLGGGGARQAAIALSLWWGLAFVVTGKGGGGVLLRSGAGSNSQKYEVDRSLSPGARTVLLLPLLFCALRFALSPRDDD